MSSPAPQNAHSPALAAAILLLAGLLLTGAAAEEKKVAKGVPPPQPAMRISLERLGFRGTPTTGLLRSRAAAMVTLDFIDSDHLLFTYATRPLMTRQSEAPNNDRMVHAEVVELPDGKVVTEKEWRLHDREVYLWPLGGGYFLLRVGGRLDLLDKDLATTKVMETDSAIRWVQADEGSNLLVVEVEREQHTKEEHDKLAHDALLFNAPAPAEDYETYGLQFRAGQQEAQQLFHIHLPQPGALTGNDEWLLQIGGSAGNFDVVALPLGAKDEKHREKHTVLRLKSECRPAMEMLGHDVALISGCGGHGRMEYAVNMEGKLLWKQTVPDPLWPYYERAANASRFAVQHVSQRSGDGINEDNLGAGEAEVFDVATGERMFATSLQPLYSTRHTVALAPDGRRLALLRQGALEIYELPPVKEVAGAQLQTAAVPAANASPTETTPAAAAKPAISK